MSKTPMMACGHAANATSQGKPCCVICLGDPKSRQVVDLPDLTGRLTKCTYGDKIVESSVNLAFFEYTGPGSRESTNKCKCGYFLLAHLPYWAVHIRVVRRWFKHENSDSITIRRIHATEDTKEAAAEQEADFFRRMMGENHREETRVKSVEVVKICASTGGIECNKFDPVGSQKYDKYYCGCHGWN